MCLGSQAPGVWAAAGVGEVRVSKAYLAGACLLAGYVEIDSGAVLGGGTVFHQFLRIGQLAMVRGGFGRWGKSTFRHQRCWLAASGLLSGNSGRP